MNPSRSTNPITQYPPTSSAISDVSATTSSDDAAIQKPFTKEELLARLDEMFVLDGDDDS